MMILIHWNFLFNKQNITPIEYGPHLKYSLELFLFNYINKNDWGIFSVNENFKLINWVIIWFLLDYNFYIINPKKLIF